MCEASPRGVQVQSPGHMDRPERLETGLPVIRLKYLAQERNRGHMATAREQAQGRLAAPSIRAGQQCDEAGRRNLPKVLCLHWPGAPGFESVYPAIPGIHVALVIAPMVHLEVVPVGYVQRAIRAVLDVDGLEPRILRSHGIAHVPRPESRS